MSARYTAELANGLGNLASRVAGDGRRSTSTGSLPEPTAYGEAEEALAGAARVDRGDGRRVRCCAWTSPAGIDAMRTFVDAVNRLPHRAGAVGGGEGPGATTRRALDRALHVCRVAARDRGAAPPGDAARPTASLWEQLGAEAALGPLGEQVVRDAGALGPAARRHHDHQGRDRCSRASRSRRLTVGAPRHGCHRRAASAPRAAQQETGHSRDLERPPLPEPLRTPGDRHPLPPRHPRRRRRGRVARRRARRSARAASVGVTRIVQVGCDLPSARWSVAARRTSTQHRRGHGRAAPERGAADLEARVGPRRRSRTALRPRSRRSPRDPRVRAVGETGLDFFRTGERGPCDVQEESFRRHIDLAKRLGKPRGDPRPRRARRRARACSRPRARRSASSSTASRATPRWRATAPSAGWFLSFAGTVTFKNAKALREAVAVAPLATGAGRDRRAVPHADAVPRPAERVLPRAAHGARDGRGRRVTTRTCWPQALWDNAQRVFGPW